MPLFITMLFIVMFSILGIFLIYNVLMSIRNKKVYSERMRVLKIVSNLNSKDIKNGKPWEWRYKELDKITYDEMLRKIWIPVKEFYKNADYLK